MAVMTVEAFLALSGAEQDAAIGRALGWESRYAPDGTVAYWQQGTGKNYKSACDVPPYATGGDADPFAAWALLAEMWKALGEVQMAFHTPALKPWGTPWSKWGMFSVEWPEPRTIDAQTPHRVLAGALVLAGLVEAAE